MSYYNGRSYTLRWEMGRQLLGSRVNSRTVYYDYNKDGIRIKKNVSGRYTDRYILDGSKVIGMERTKSGSSVRGCLSSSMTRWATFGRLFAI